MPPLESPVPPTVSYPSQAPTGMATWKLIALIVGGVLLVAILGRGIWAYQAMKSDEAKTAQQTPATTTAGNFEVHYDNTNSTSTDEVKMKVDISGPTFTDAQLANFRADLVIMYSKYGTKTDVQKNTEPLKTQIGKELDAIFLKDLGVITKIAAGDLGGSMMLMQPQVAQIMSEVEAQGDKTVVTTAVPTATLTANSLRNLNVKVGDKINMVWSSTNANSFHEGNSATKCSKADENSAFRENSSTASGSQSMTVHSDYAGCVITTTFTAKNTTTGKQAIATVVINVSSSVPVATATPPANKCSVITMTNAMSTVPARQSIDFPPEGATLIAGQTYTTSWFDEKYNSPDSYPVYLSMTPNNDPLGNLGTAYKAQCSFDFTIPSSATPGSNYRLMFNRNGFTSIYSNQFTISN